MLDRSISHELKVIKRAFHRAIPMIGTVADVAVLLASTDGQVSKWRSDQYGDRLPAELFPKIDAAAGYPVMLEALATLCGYTLQRDEVSHPDMPICSLVGSVAAASGKALQTVLVADADDQITPREFNCIEAEGRTVIADVNRLIEAARAKSEAGR
ncbi:hypothetical protein [Consotaella aegiceratis]|uniref:hypothetical protein n=1 Tax=Consotaella aegiceratis TaxID=3097961 RepID=UPI002F414753